MFQDFWRDLHQTTEQQQQQCGRVEKKNNPSTELCLWTGQEWNSLKMSSLKKVHKQFV